MSVRAKLTAANDRNDDIRRAATKDMPQTREDAASAKRENPKSGLSALPTLALNAANDRNGSFEPSLRQDFPKLVSTVFSQPLVQLS